MIRMKARQYQNICSLIRNICCNYDRVTGGCLLLDDGEVVKCPQMLTQSLACRYFHSVLLEEREAKGLKNAISGEDHRRTCVICGLPFQATGNRAKYCVKCGGLVRRKQATERKRKQRSIVTI